MKSLTVKGRENNARRHLRRLKLSLVKIRLHGSKEKSYIIVDSRRVVAGDDYKMTLNAVDRWMETAQHNMTKKDVVRKLCLDTGLDADQFEETYNNLPDLCNRLSADDTFVVFSLVFLRDWYCSDYAQLELELRETLENCAQLELTLRKTLESARLH